MSANETQVGMLKIVSATIAFSLGVGLTFSSAIVAVAVLFG